MTLSEATDGIVASYPSMDTKELEEFKNQFIGHLLNYPFHYIYGNNVEETVRVIAEVT